MGTFLVSTWEVMTGCGRDCSSRMGHQIESSESSYLACSPAGRQCSHRKSLPTLLRPFASTRPLRRKSRRRLSFPIHDHCFQPFTSPMPPSFSPQPQSHSAPDTPATCLTHAASHTAARVLHVYTAPFLRRGACCSCCSIAVESQFRIHGELLAMC